MALLHRRARKELQAYHHVKGSEKLDAKLETGTAPAGRQEELACRHSFEKIMVPASSAIK